MVNECSICLNNMEHEHVLECKHAYHFHCLVSWVQKANTCPLCRNKVHSRDIVLAALPKTRGVLTRTVRRDLRTVFDQVHLESFPLTRTHRYIS